MQAKEGCRDVRRDCEIPYDAALRVAGNCCFEFDDDAPPADVGAGVLLSCSDVADCIEADLFEKKRLTPKGAALMIRLYEAGLFERQRSQDGLGDPVELRAYARSEADLRARTEARRADDERSAPSTSASLLIPIMSGRTSSTSAFSMTFSGTIVARVHT